MAPAAAANAAEAETEPAPPVLTLADVGDITGRNDVPESSMGGETTCIVCMAHPKTHLAVPCAHQCACGACAEQMQTCPGCRAPVQRWLHAAGAHRQRKGSRVSIRYPGSPRMFLPML